MIASAHGRLGVYEKIHTCLIVAQCFTSTVMIDCKSDQRDHVIIIKESSSQNKLGKRRRINLPIRVNNKVPDVK